MNELIYQPSANQIKALTGVPVEKFQRSKVEFVPQWPYSADLKLCDRFINHKLKEHVRQLDLNTPEEVTEAPLHYLRSIPECFERASET